MEKRGERDERGATRRTRRTRLADGLRIPSERSSSVSLTQNTARESAVVDRIVAAIRRTPGSYVRKIHGGAFTAGLPDLVGCHRGRFFAVEVKRSGQRPSKMQVMDLLKWRAAGGFAVWTESYDEFLFWWNAVVLSP
jgi:hypothetical protein